MFHVKQTGILISFEGMDGSGKTTQMNRLADRLRALGRDFWSPSSPAALRSPRKSAASSSTPNIPR